MHENIEYDIVLPFYRDYDFLDRQIVQINNQTLLPKRLIFIDDGNNDIELKNKITTLLNKEIDLIFVCFRKNQGLYKGIKEGIKHIKSEYFRFNATDDVYYPNLSKHSLLLLSKYPQTNLVFSKNISNFYPSNKKIKLNLNFLNKEYYPPSKAEDIFKKNQFKIYHNTVFYRSNYFIKNHMFKKEFGQRCDMFNLLLFSMNSGFCYVNEYLSEFIIRKGQLNKIQKNYDLYLELLNLEKKKPLLAKYYISLNMHFDFNPLAIFLFINKKRYDLINMKWINRSFKFFIWKITRKYLPSKFIERIFEYIN